MPLIDVTQHPHSVEKSPAKRKAEEPQLEEAAEVDQENKEDEDMGAAR